MRKLAAQFLAFAERRQMTALLPIAHRLMGTSLLCTGDIAEARSHHDKGIMLYDPVKHRPLAMRFGQDSRVIILSYRSIASWLLGYPEVALADAEHALRDAREIGQAATLMVALAIPSLILIQRGDYAAASSHASELVALAEEKSASYWKAYGMMNRGCVLSETGKAADAVSMITSGLTAYRSTESTAIMPLWLSYVARANVALGKFDEAWRCIGEATIAVEKTKETWLEAEVHRVAGEIELTTSEHDASKAEGYFQRALSLARSQQAKSWELRAAMSMARLWRDQGKQDEARELLAPVYSWFTEGFDTRDLKEAKALLNELAS
jgi:predicted ATPase